ncbi:esterase-like activity of phytase family protein [Phormidium sp. CLA17]|uniref:esterase-like activity of phytase family protein n=1 Tax=Leptolyngbya sp. Cla-17 TaxID=2803751 RepID=UPI001490FEA9|nr:esterase-like activity of phytase family protein [Leptolyngbya sp. Cla-17]MBM0743848.1 esterase-like activity of phytase family protein [Leptolyngbya sp. Cla-17]
MATFSQSRLSALAFSLSLSALGFATGTQSAQAFTFVNSLSIPGNATDLASAPTGNSANTNRLGGFGSDLYYDRDNKVFYGVVDRGPGGGTIPYDTRVEKFTVDIDPNSGGISNFKLLSTILFTDQTGENFNGFDPLLLNGAANVLGRSLDPEGFAIAPNGNFYVSDEYGPSVKEFTPAGKLVREFEIPANLLARDAQGNLAFSGDSSVTVAQGRQANRGFEGLAITPDGSKLIAVLQDPLTQEGTPTGRSSRNVRLVVFDAATGKSTAQYVYPLETVAEINARIPGTTGDFGATAQGRNIGVSSIVALNDHEFIVLERDNRGVGVDDPTGKNPVGSKRTFKIDITGATDVSNISLTGSNNAIAGVTPVGKSLYFDIQALLAAAGQTIPEKFEGFTFGPQLANGSYSILVATDNDFSVTQNGTGVQFDVCTNGANVALDTSCPSGSTLLPSYLYAFTATAAELGNYVAPTSNAAVPEPTTMTGMALAGLGSLWLKRRKKSS